MSRVLVGLLVSLSVTACDAVKNLVPAPPADECPGSGVSGCRGSNRVVCEKGDEKYVWVAVAECSAGCIEGQCAPGATCEDRCPAEGVTGCSGENLAVVCAKGDGCLVWAQTAACAKGCLDGACVGPDNCRDECPAEEARGCRNDDLVLCARGEGCLLWTTLATCTNGCADGACNPGNTCEDQCPGEGVTGCRGDVVARCTTLDGCLGWADVETCREGCLDGRCKVTCQPACGERQCGDDGCGGSCGSCADGQDCVDGSCVPACDPKVRLDCCGKNLCWFDSCGQQGAFETRCPYGCEAATCLDCVPSCEGKTCGTDGCGGTCGTCTGGSVCQVGKCVCSARDHKACCGTDVCWVDSCGTVGDVAETCVLSCSNASCVNCIPACEGRQCGSDGCGGTCGTCPEGEECSATGMCAGNGPGRTVTGRLIYDARMATISGSRVLLDQVKTLAAAGVVTWVIDSSGDSLGVVQTDADGRFSIPLTRPLSGGERLVFAALWAPSLDSNAVMGVLKPTRGGTPGHLTSSPWAWSFNVPINGMAGDLRVREEQGSGALYLFLFNTSGLVEIIDNFLGGDGEQAKTLALMWAPGVAWDCGACFSSWVWQALESGGGFEQSIFIGGETNGSSAWSHPVILHEFGHYLASNYSRDNSPGGSHGGYPIVPPFAWSEGWASYFSLSTMSRWLGESLPTYWDIQSGSSFWMDLSSVTTSYGSLSAPDMTQPITQNLDEMWVAAMLWHLWDGSEFPEPPKQDDGVAVTTQAMFAAMRSSRFLYRDRGYRGVDFVDFADSVVCATPSIGPAVESLLRDYMGFPYVLSQRTCN